MSQVIIGMGPHKRSATIEVMASDETVAGGGRHGTDAAGYRAMLAKARQWPERTWARRSAASCETPTATWWRSASQRAPDCGRSGLVRVMPPGVPTHTDGMPVRLHHIVVDAHDLPGLARFWTQALGWKILSEREREIVIGTDENAPVGMCFMPVTDPKMVKNRVHLDLTTSAQDRDQEIERLLALGARRAGIGQTGAESWTVLADPEGNEFCVIRPKESLTR
jgi:predicted enzyme related to lactoylglutathione lyase